MTGPVIAANEYLKSQLAFISIISLKENCSSYVVLFKIKQNIGTL